MKKLFITAAFLAFFGGINAQEQTTSGLIITGFYDDFESTEEFNYSDGSGIFWEPHFEGEILTERKEGYLDVEVKNLGTPDWEPLEVSFGTVDEIRKSIDLSNSGEIKIVITNDNNVDTYIQFEFLDKNNYIGIRGNAESGEENVKAAHPEFLLKAGETREAVVDLSNGLAGSCYYTNNFDVSCLEPGDMENIIGFVIEFYTAEFEVTVDNAKFRIHSVKVGEIDGSERSDIITSTENSMHNKIFLYPNPVQSQLSISEAGSLTIYSADGIEMLQETVESGSSVNVASWSNGIYFVKLINEAGEFTTSFVKQ